MAKYPAASQIEFNPGIYIITGSNDSAASIISTFNQWVRDNPFIRGIVVKQRWGYATANQPAMEAGQGVYDFSHLQAVVDHVKQYPGKYVAFWPSYKLFTSDANMTPAIVPAYIRTAAYNGGAYMSGGTSTARIWRPDVCDEWVRVLEDWCDHFSGETTINMISGAEAAPGPLAAGESDWPGTTQFTQRLVQIAKATAIALPHAVTTVGPNASAADRQVLVDDTKISPWFCGIACTDVTPFRSQLTVNHDLIRNNAGNVILCPHMENPSTGELVANGNGYPDGYPLKGLYPEPHYPDAYECLYYAAYYLKGNYIFVQLSQANGQSAASIVQAINQLGAEGIIPVIPQEALSSGFIPSQVRETAAPAIVDLNDGQITEVAFVNKFADAAAPSAPTITLATSGRYFVEVTA